MYYAHSLDSDKDKSRWQDLPDHLHAVGRLAAGFARPFGAEAAAGLAGLLHDLGKYSGAFQARLNGSGERVDHSTAGAVAVRAAANDSGERWDQLMTEVLSYAIAGHHAGLPDGQNLADRLEGEYPPLWAHWREEMAVQPRGLKPSLCPRKSWPAFQLAFLGRMIFSCLVDADYRDTEAFYARASGSFPDRDCPALPGILDELIGRFDRYMAAKQAGAEDTPVNRLRRDILTHVRQRAVLSPELFTLTVPTGGGKTLASLGFALDHAKRHGLVRIIYAIPFTSVIDQTAAIFRDVLGDDVVLEHHSAIEEEKYSSKEQRDTLRLAMEDWAAPVVVTTNVQLFESLFANRPSRCRKLHNLAKSVIVLDEAQTLPLPLLRPCVAAIDELARNYGASVVLCTATQPALDRRHFDAGNDMGIDLEGRELAPDSEGLALRLKRVSLKKEGAIDDERLVAELQQQSQAMVIVNSRKHALVLYRRARQAGLEGVVHLSTRQYAADRRDILARVKNLLENKQPCRLIATSLVEAGVDLDFPRVWRAEAGLDQIAQAAGRCNREGKHPAEESIVTVFAAPDNPPPCEIAQLSSAYARMAGEYADPFSPSALTRYFREVYWAKGPALDKKKILSRFSFDVTGVRFDYQRVADDFRMIESGLAPVIVAREKEARDALALLGHISPGAVARKLQPFIVQVPPKARARLLACGHIRFERESEFGDQFAALKTESLYRKDVGLMWEDAEYLGLEQTVM